MARKGYVNPWPMRRWTAFQDSVTRKLSSMLSIMAANLFIGTAKLSVEPGTKGLAETSNIPRTALGCDASISMKGYFTMEPQPAP